MSLSSVHDHPLHTFLRERKVDGRTGTWTLTKMSTTGGGKWNVADADYPQFLDLLNDYLHIQHFRPQNLVEQRRADGYSPLLIDLDFQYSPQHAIVHRFDDKNIKNFVRNYIDTLKELYDVSGQTELRFFVCLRKTPYEKKGGSTRVLKDGVHIECPDLCLHAEKQQIVRLAMLEKEAVRKSFDGTEYTNADADVYDESVIKKNGWFFYGESKENIPPYELTSLWSYNCGTDSLLKKPISAYTKRQLLEMLSIRHGVEPADVEVREERQIEYEHFKALLARPPPIAAAAIADPEQTPAQKEMLAELNAAVDKSYTDSEIAMARRFVLECLANQRADGFQTWLDVGWCLHTIDPSEDGFNLWMEFSQRSPKFSGNDVRDLQYKWATNWGKPPGTNCLKMGTLRMWAKQDNAEKYKEIVDSDIVDFILRTVRGGHYDVAKVMHRLYNDRYTAFMEKKNTEWYEFRNNTWENIPQAFSIRSLLSEDFTAYIWEAFRQKRRQLEDQNMTEGVRETSNEQTKLLLKVIDKLGQTEYKSSVLKEAASLFHDRDFISNLDADPYLVGTASTVLNIRTETGNPSVPYKVTWRAGKASDYVSFQMGNYPNERIKPVHYMPYDPSATCPIQAEIDDFMEKVFPRADLRAYMWRLMAAHLEGMNREQLFYIWTGRGGNGKSVLDKIMRYTFGDYAFTLPSTVLTRKSGDSGAANPEIIGMRNRRYISMTEPETYAGGSAAPLNVSLMKKYTGNDQIEARGLFQDQQYFKIAGRIHLLCNEKPAINSNDGGTWRRIRVIPFEALFKDADDPEWKNPDLKHIHLKDYTLEERIKRWPQALFSRLVWIYENEYLKNGLNPEPEIVKQASEEYRAKSDHFAAFRTSRIRTGSNPEVLANEHALNDIYKKYLTWHGEFASGMPKMKQDEVSNRLEEFLGKSQGQRKIFKKCIVFSSDEEVEAFDNSVTAGF